MAVINDNEELSENELKQLEEEIDKIANDYEEASKKQKNVNCLISSIFYLIILFGFGLPIWYRTTTPERWPLPDISSLMVRSQTITHYYKISIVCLEPPVGFETNQLKQYLQGNYPKRINFDNSLSFIHEWSVRAAFDRELSVVKSINYQNVSNVLNEIDQQLSMDKIQLFNSIMFFILPKNVVTDKLFTLGRYRSFFIDLNHLNQCHENDLVTCLGDQINHKVENIQFLVGRFYSPQIGDQEQNIFLLLARKFDFLFDIIYEEDETSPYLDLEARKVYHQRWIKNIDNLINSFYTHRFNFSRFFWINFVTQVLHFVFPNENFISSKLVKKDNSTHERLLPLSSVESILNSIESRRMEHDNDKSYHLVLYVTSSSLSPLVFYNEQNGKKSNLISTPFRGSILILNEEKDLNEGFQKMIRLFFGLSQKINFENEFFTQLEIESIVRALVQKHILETLNSLESIERLLNKVSNMVIEKKIAERIHHSLECSMKAIDYLKEKDIVNAYEFSWEAYYYSEKAFYDPSLLSLLYFPDDQKYAIYLPLFLPICIPLLHNIKYLFKVFTNRNKSKMD